MSLQNLPMVSYSAGNALAIQVFEQRNGVLTRNTRQFFELSHIDFRRLAFSHCQLLAQVVESASMEDEFFGDLNQHLIAQEQSNDFLGAHAVDLQVGKDIF